MESGTIVDEPGAGAHSLLGDVLSEKELRDLVKPQTELPAATAFDFVYRDTDVAMKEVEEFYSYVEAPQSEQNKAMFDRDFKGDWVGITEVEREEYVKTCLRGLQDSDADVRFENLRKLMHIAQGTYGYATNLPHHLAMLQNNCRTLRRASAIPIVYESLKAACKRHNHIHAEYFDPLKMTHPSPNSAEFEKEKGEALDEANTETAFYLTLIFQISGASRVTPEDTRICGNALMALDPPFPAYLFELVADLRERNTPGYPVKKLLLLLWKTLIICLGTTDQLRSAKKTAQELYGLPREPKEPKKPTFVSTKANPLDFYLFREELASKFPSYKPPEPAVGPVPVDMLAAALMPTHGKVGSPNDGQFVNGAVALPALSTPAPSPPSTPASSGPKPKKLQFQTPQDTPFVLPFSFNDRSMAPDSIQEAAELFKQNVWVSKDVIQLWKEKERAEGRLFGTSDEDIEKNRQLLMQDESKAEDLDKLAKADFLYRCMLPQLQSVVIVLLKLLLATVTAQSGVTEASADSDSDQIQPPQAETLEVVDVRRHREITCKAISGIFLMTLRWFKASHILQFEHLSQLLVDSNCLLLILKMYGLQEINRIVYSHGEHEEYNFFRYCATHGSKYTPEALKFPYHVLSKDGSEAVKPSNGPAHHGAYLIGPRAYSWRNLFSLVNFTRILQKVTKRKTHRILLLVQYKSSAILKRLLKLPEPTLQLYVLKVLKSQVPYCGRKWRQSNMKIITSIYLNCRPDLRDDWIAGIDVEGENIDSKPHEQSLRNLIQSYNDTHHPDRVPIPSQSPSLNRGQAFPSQEKENSFPPRRPRPSLLANQSGKFAPPSSDDVRLDYLQDLHDIIESVFQQEVQEQRRKRRFSRSSSDSESDKSNSDGEDPEDFSNLRVMDALSLDGEGANDENRTDWLHMSPQTIGALSNCPQSPRNSPSHLKRLSAEGLFEHRDGYDPMQEERGGVDEVEYIWEE